MEMGGAPPDAPLQVGPLLPSGGGAAVDAARRAPPPERRGGGGATGDVAALRLPRNTLSARRALVRAATTGEALPSLLARLPGRQGAVVRELAADVLALRARLEVVVARVEAAGGGGGGSGGDGVPAPTPAPLVAVEVQAELAERTARLLDAAGPELGAALLRELTAPAAEVTAREQLGLPALGVAALAQTDAWTRHSLDSRVVPNSRSRATVAHEALTRGTAAHVFAHLPQLAWGVPTPGEAGAPPLRPPRNPLPPHPANALSVDNILPDGSRDVWGLASRAQHSVITGAHLGRGLAGLREALVLAGPENISSYARQQAYYGKGGKGDAAVSSVWEDVYAQRGAGGGAGGGASAGTGAAPPEASAPPPPPRLHPLRSGSRAATPPPATGAGRLKEQLLRQAAEAQAAQAARIEHLERELLRLKDAHAVEGAQLPPPAQQPPQQQQPTWAAPTVFPHSTSKSLALSPSHLASAYSETRQAPPPQRLPVGEVDLEKLFRDAAALEGLLLGK